MVQDVTLSALSLSEVIQRSLVRAVSAVKVVQLVTAWLEEHDLAGQAGEDVVADALVSCLTSPPAILFNYIGQCLSASLCSGRILVIRLLLELYDGQQIPSSQFTSLALVVYRNPTGLDLPFPSSVDHKPVSNDEDIAEDQTESIPTLTLLLPLIRECTSTPSPLPLLALVNRLLTLLPQSPTPPLSVGLEAGALMQSLPDAVVIPLRNYLSGLMVDLFPPADTQMGDGSMPVDMANPGQTVNGLNPAPDQGKLHSGPMPLPLPQVLAFLLIHAITASAWLPADAQSSSPDPNLVNIIRLGPRLAADPATFLLHLVRASIKIHTGEYWGGSFDGIQRWLFMMERLPLALSWWKEHSLPDWPYPSNLSIALSTVFELEAMSMGNYNSFISTALTMAPPHVDGEEDFVKPEGWMLCTEQVTLVARLLEAQLLDQKDAEGLLGNIALPRMGAGESLFHRVTLAPRSHLRTLALITSYAPAAAKIFTSEVLNCIRAAPNVSPPDDLFLNLASEPLFTALLTACVNATTLLDLVEKHLLNSQPPDADDPQGAVTRFGEGVVFAETVVSLCHLRTRPRLLEEARTALPLADLTPAQRTSALGWYKALFGPDDGIDDQILLATLPADFYRLAPTIVQTAISSAAAGQLEIDTLQSGLSYFSQPLLSWTLGGIVAWLCEEIVSYGPMSPLHLTVLQNLILSESFPTPLLRVTGIAVAQLLDPTAGLGPVLQSSSFDIMAVQQKLDSLNLVASPVQTLDPLEELRSELQSASGLDGAEFWASSLCRAMDSCLFDIGPTQTTTLIIDQVLANAAVNPDQSDLLTHLSSLFLTTTFSPDQSLPLLGPCIDAVLPMIIEAASSLATPANGVPLPTGPTLQARTLPLAKLIKAALLNLASTEDLNADILVDHLVDLLLFLGQSMSNDKRRTKTSHDRGTADQSRMVDFLSSELGGDAELRGRWRRFGELVSSP